MNLFLKNYLKNIVNLIIFIIFYLQRLNIFTKLKNIYFCIFFFLFLFLNTRNINKIDLK